MTRSARLSQTSIPQFFASLPEPRRRRTRQFFATVIPERCSMDSIDVLASAIRLDNLGGDEEVRDAFEEMLIEIGFLAHAIDVGPVRRAVRFGGNSARPKHRSHGTIPVTAVR